MHIAIDELRNNALFFDALYLTINQGKPMEIKHILIIIFVVFCVFMVANWLNRPKPDFYKTSDKPKD